MNARTCTLAVLLAAILAVPGASAQDVYINGQAVTLEEIRELQQKLGIPEDSGGEVLVRSGFRPLGDGGRSDDGADPPWARDRR